VENGVALFPTEYPTAVNCHPLNSLQFSTVPTLLLLGSFRENINHKYVFGEKVFSPTFQTPTA
jgi:hypothetical protein